ncbi:MAG TPA: ABC transporter permease [Bryobacteraceae bacterium]|jgi:putative ABC transport system permease protein|nr:ABC transporter permease [Bryobacteraceae bacterium]
MTSLLSDARHGLRMLRRNPGFATLAILTLALGIGATSAIFSVVDGALLRPLPFPDPNRLMLVWGRLTGQGLPRDHNPISPAEVIDIRTRNRVFEDVAAYTPANVALTSGGQPERISSAQVSASFFPLLGVAPAQGRWFTPDEDRPGSRVVMLSHELWQRRFGGDRGLVGSSIRMDGDNYTVAGIMPPRFEAIDRADIWTPIAFTPQNLSIDERGSHYLTLLARRKAGVSMRTSQTDMDRIAAELAREFPDYYKPAVGWGLPLVSLADELTFETRPALLLLAGAVSLLLWIACANVANLMLVRGAAREREMAVRAALGAGKLRLVRQLLVEGALVAIAAGAIGLLMVAWSGDALARILPQNFAPLGRIHLDARVLAFTFLISLLTSLLFGALPAFRASRLGDHTRSVTTGRRTRRAQNLVVVSEIALSVVLLAGAGLLIKSFARLLSVDPGFRTHGVLTMKIALPPSRYPNTSDLAAFYQRAIENIRQVPGVESAGIVPMLPLGGSGSSGCYEIEEHPSDPTKKCPEGDRRPVSADYFRTMGIELLRGRYFDARDEAEKLPRVAIVDETLAAKSWPGENPIGKRIKLSGAKSDRPFVQVVGVVRHVHNRDLSVPSRVQLYWPYSQGPWPFTAVVVRATAGDPMALARPVERAILGVDPEMPVYAIRSMDDVLARSVAQRKLTMALVLAFSVLAALLAAIGIYGVLAYGVAQRAREIGIRMAVGARRADVVALIGAEAVWLAFAGLAIGIAGALALARFASGQLFGVSPADLQVFAVASGLVGAISLLAAFIPARRAASIDPMSALRQE